MPQRHKKDRRQEAFQEDQLSEGFAVLLTLTEPVCTAERSGQGHWGPNTNTLQAGDLEQ